METSSAWAGETYLPLYEAKMAGLFDHRAANTVISATAVIRQGQPEEITESEHESPDVMAMPRFWVAAKEVDKVLGDSGRRTALLAWRRVTATTNERTLLVSLLPRTAVGDSLFVLLTDLDGTELLLCANIGSVIFDYIARQKLGGNNASYFVIEQLPVISSQHLSSTNSMGARLACRLGHGTGPRAVFTARDMTPSAREIGIAHRPSVGTQNVVRCCEQSSTAPSSISTASPRRMPTTSWTRSRS